MSIDLHFTFHLARAAAERIAAIRASSNQARALHTEMAQAHADRAWLISDSHEDDGSIAVARTSDYAAPAAFAAELEQQRLGLGPTVASPALMRDNTGRS